MAFDDESFPTESQPIQSIPERNILTLQTVRYILKDINCFSDPISLTIKYPTENANIEENNEQKKRRVPLKWTIEEKEFLLNGYRKFDKCWTQILKEFPMNPLRRRYDLKDKWKNLLKKQNEQKYIAFFSEISRLKEQRSLLLSQSSVFVHEKSDSHSEKIILSEKVSKIKKEMENCVPHRHLQYILKYLESPLFQQTIIDKWNSVMVNQSLVFKFIESVRSLEQI